MARWQHTILRHHRGLLWAFGVAWVALALGGVVGRVATAWAWAVAGGVAGGVCAAGRLGTLAARTGGARSAVAAVPEAQAARHLPPPERQGLRPGGTWPAPVLPGLPAAAAASLWPCPPARWTRSGTSSSCTTQAYRDWCEVALGHFLHHTPAEALGAKASSNDGLRRAWYWACRDEAIQPRTPTRLPLLFALDAKLAIPNGFVYAADCGNRLHPLHDNASGAAHCGTSFSDGSHSGDDQRFWRQRQQQRWRVVRRWRRWGWLRGRRRLTVSGLAGDPNTATPLKVKPNHRQALVKTGDIAIYSIAISAAVRPQPFLA